MPTLHPPKIDVQKAKAIWQEYQRDHDITPMLHKTVGIDPETGDVWFGESALDAAQQQTEQLGLSRPLFFIEVGKDYYVKKGGRR
jgi:hypothetical protein